MPEIDLVCDRCTAGWYADEEYDACPLCGGRLRPAAAIDAPASYRGGQPPAWLGPVLAAGLTIAGAMLVYLLANGGPR